MSSRLQIRDLLNPVTPDPSEAGSEEAYSQISSTQAVAGSMSVRQTLQAREWPSRHGKQRGPVNYMPYEHGLGAETLRQIEQFHVRPFGEIRQSCEHIPYNSSKKDFFGKTGRESIDVLKYEFRARGSDRPPFVVMWDYDVGLVRITPFFKCLGYAKTKPSQMLDKNPGLRDITPSITGGAVSAQGYWMPYKCARAVCATFCYAIAGALIPLFGPTFPDECRVPGTPGFRDMVIDPRIIEEATREAYASRSMQLRPSQPLAPRPIEVKHPPLHPMEPRPYEMRPPRTECARILEPTPVRVPSWRPINGGTSPITPPRSSNSPRAAISGNMDSFRHHQYVEDTQCGMVLVNDGSPEQHRRHSNHIAGGYPVTPFRPPPQGAPEGYGLKRRYVSPVIVGYTGQAGERIARAPSRTEANPRKRTYREGGGRRIEDYHAASALVGLQGEAQNRPRG